MRLIEQPEGGAAGEQRGECGAAALTGREATGRRRAEAPGQAEALEGLLGALDGQPQGSHGELDVLRRAEVVVERGGMAQKPDVPAHRRVVRGQVDPEDGGLARGHRQQPGTGAQEAGLAGAVGADHDDDLTLVERQIDPGKGGEAAGERDRGTKVDDWGHGLRHHGRGGGSQGSKRGSGGGSAPGRDGRPAPVGSHSGASARSAPPADPRGPGLLSACGPAQRSARATLPDRRRFRRGRRRAGPPRAPPGARPSPVPPGSVRRSAGTGGCTAR